MATHSQEPAVFEGHPFIVEAGVSIGGKNAREGVTVYRFANRIPLLFEGGGDVVTRTAMKRIKYVHSTGMPLPRVTNDSLQCCRFFHSNLDQFPIELSSFPLVGCQSSKHTKAECVHALKGLTLPWASHSGEIALLGVCCLHSAVAIAITLFPHAFLRVSRSKCFQHPY